MNTVRAGADPVYDLKRLKDFLHRYQNPDPGHSWWQVINSFVPYILLFITMYFLLDVSIWLTMLLAVPAAGFMIRIFIIFHDCGHGSFFNSKKMSRIVGFIAGVLTFVPYEQWRYSHAIHHATCGDLDRRGSGDVWTMTVNEYQQQSKWKKLTYRLYRNPLAMFGIGPFYIFLIEYRFPSSLAKKRERKGVLLTNLGILALVSLLIWLLGLKSYLLIQLPILIIALTAGVWLFYVQHQYEDVYWARHEQWNFDAAALEGSSYYHLPAILQWFTGNIGFHHVHHLNARIPNYYLKSCHTEIVKLKPVKTLTLLSSLKSLKFRLFDEDLGQMVGFGYLRKLKKA